MQVRFGQCRSPATLPIRPTVKNIWKGADQWQGQVFKHHNCILLDWQLFFFLAGCFTATLYCRHCFSRQSIFILVFSFLFEEICFRLEGLHTMQSISIEMLESEKKNLIFFLHCYCSALSKFEDKLWPFLSQKSYLGSSISDSKVKSF